MCYLQLALILLTKFSEFCDQAALISFRFHSAWDHSSDYRMTILASEAFPLQLAL